MVNLYVTVPIACFRKGIAREYLETELLPTPATCYGFLLSLVGEVDRQQHIGVRVTAGILNRPPVSVVLRTVWRCKDRNYWTDPNGRHHVVSTDAKIRRKFVDWVVSQGWNKPTFEIGLGNGTNARPDYQQLLTGIELTIWVDSSDEVSGNLEERVRRALTRPAEISRFGGLSLGESTHLIDEICFGSRADNRIGNRRARTFLLRADGTGELTLPVWVDHVGSAKTRYANGDLVLDSVTSDRLPRISPE
jgi:CRISPR-associated protein Cas5t